MAKLSTLGLKAEAAGEALDYTDLPEFGGMRPLHPTGPYRFRLPAPAPLSDCWSKVEHWNTELPNRERVEATFEAAAALVIVQGPVAGMEGQLFETRINNMERNRGKRDSGIIASDLDFLLRALGEKVRPKGNVGQGQALVARASHEFGADNQYSWRCSKKRDAYFEYADGQGGTTYAPRYAEGVTDQNVEHVAEDERYVKGCGKTHYPDRDVQKAGGEYPEHLACQGCGARIRAFEGLENFRA